MILPSGSVVLSESRPVQCSIQMLHCEKYKLFEYIKKIAGSADSVELVHYSGLASLKTSIKKNEHVKSVSLDDESTLTVKLKRGAKDNCLLKNLGNGKLVFVTFWEISPRDRITYFVAATLWNDNKRGSHLTCSYITQKQLCVMESHINLEWGVTERYFAKLLENYLSSIVLFTNHIESTREYIKKLPKPELTLLDKLQAGADIADAVSSIWNLFDA
jgi:hypothetical protein